MAASTVIPLIRNFSSNGLDDQSPNMQRLVGKYSELNNDSITMAQAIHDLASALLEGPCTTRTIRHFSTVLVDVVLDISSRSLENNLELIQNCALSARLAELVPHLRGLLQEVFSSQALHIGRMIDSRSPEEICVLVRSLRTLLSLGCIPDISSIDLGALLGLILQRSTDDYNANAVIYQAASLFFEAVGGVSPLLQQEHLLNLCHRSRLPSLMVADGTSRHSDRMEVLPQDQVRTESVMEAVGSITVPVLDNRVYTTSAGDVSTMNICGVKFPYRRQAAKLESPLSSEIIFTENTMKNLRKIAVAVASEVPILLQGCAGAGKSFLIREFAGLLGQKSSLVELHLDESTDSKSLIGNYTCSDVPGTFIWQPGLITQAVLKGHWLVIEDVDTAPAEILAALVPLIERRRLYLPNRMEEVQAHPGFRIFGTRTVASPLVESIVELEAGLDGTAYTPPDALVSGRSFLSAWHVLQLSPLAVDEIKNIITRSFPQLLPQVVEQLLSVYRNMSVGAMRSFASKGSVPTALLSSSLALTVRVLLRIAKRIASRVTFNVDSLFIPEQQNEDMLMEVLDVVVAKCRTDQTLTSGAGDAVAQCLCGMIATAWGGVSGEYVHRLWTSRSPQLSVYTPEGGTGKYITIGRVTMNCSASAVSTGGSKSSDAPKEGHTNNGVFAHAAHTLRVLEKIAGAIDVSEPILLVGETGCGKTTSVQKLAEIMDRKLIVLNISLSTDVNELLGGFRPVTMRQMFMPSYETFLQLFQETFSHAQNTAYLLAVSQIFKKQNWRKLLQSFKKAGMDAGSKLEKQKSAENDGMIKRWSEFMKVVCRYEANLSRIENGFAFAFVEGMLVDAMRKGHWILLDEINLASPETLQGLTGILDGLSLCLTERGDVEPVVRDPEFRIFAAMNPPTDVGKRELSASLRSRFTEIYVEEMLMESDLRDVAVGYLADISGGSAERVAADVVTIYLKCRQLSETVLVDTAGVRPRYSLRSLTRALKTAASYLAIGIKPLNRALYEAFLLTFATLLDDEGKKYLTTYFQTSLNLKADKQLSQPPTRPGGRGSDASEWVLVKPFWLRAGSLSPVDWAEKAVAAPKTFMAGAKATPGSSSVEDTSLVASTKPKKRFVLTPSVDGNIRCLAAAVAANVAPVLLQGPTSVGKTSMIEYLAARSGHKCVRINNHEHTDVQEYIGGYITNDQGRLVFHDGLLVQALRNGHWIILDELNLAPSDVLEALNRLLDDNKELLIPETGELVHPAPGFALFATQNPPGIYGGRKPLSRAFRNRFIEIHIGDLPLSEIEEIVHQVCGIPKKFSVLEVGVMNELQLMRQQSTLFQGKHGALTTRDLIKWGNRKPDSVLSVAIFGYMLLAEKLRSQGEKDVIIETLQTVCKVKLDLSGLYLHKGVPRALPPGAVLTCADECDRLYGQCLQELDVVRAQLSAGEILVKGVSGVAPTLTVQRMWVLVNQCVNHSEAVLMVGETGSGKTTVCQLLAAHRGQNAHIVNCHQSTETADIIGGLRPVRNRENIFANTCKLICEMFNVIMQIADDASEAKFSQTHSIIAALPADIEVMDDAALCADVVVQRINEDSVKQSMAELKHYVDSLSVGSSGGDASPLKRARADSSINSDEKIAALQGCMTKVSESWKRYKALFEWQDGPLVIAMKQGDMFVLDEINLADDAVIERLNSVLESGREITLAEKGGGDGIETEKIIAHPNFRFMGTMNPGGDFGKRELSPALRSRFTELWVPAVQDKNDLVMIVKEMLSQSVPTRLVALVATCIVEFAEWVEITATQMHLPAIKFSVREIVAWVKFISFWTEKALSEAAPGSMASEDGEHVFVAYVHGAQVLVLDGLGIGSSSVSRSSVIELKNLATTRLISSCPESVRGVIIKSLSIDKEVLEDIDGSADRMDVVLGGAADSLPFIQPEIVENGSVFRLGYFSIPCGGAPPPSGRSSYVLSARSTVLNMHRVLRALQLPRPILLEGAPGVGKTSLISSLAALSGHKLVRINLSEHSEISDLLGTDLPKVKKFTEEDDSSKNDASPAQNDNSLSFAWCDGIFLSALKRGDWVLLDELNLAPQSVLEGLNACFDHRGEIFLPEIGMSFKAPPTFRVFCAQNPVMEGGGRKGLPQSFLSRFSRVFVDPMSSEDMTAIAMASFTSPVQPTAESSYLQLKIPQMINMITDIQYSLDVSKSEVADFGRMGSPWEFNLRDVIRWCELFDSLSQQNGSVDNILSSEATCDYALSRSAHLLFSSRMRTAADRAHMASIYHKTFAMPLQINLSPEIFLLPESRVGVQADPIVSIGAAQCRVQRRPGHSLSSRPFKASGSSSICLGRMFGEAAIFLENLALCASLRWPVLLIGSPGAGKRRSVRYLAELTGNHLVEFAMTSSVDASDILGSFEQANAERQLRRVLGRLERIVLRVSSSIVFDRAQYGESDDTSRGVSSIATVDLWRRVSLLCTEVFTYDLIRLDKGRELLQLVEELISMLWASQEEALRTSLSEAADKDAARKELLEVREAFMLFVMENNSSESSTGFEWVDGILLQAMQLGRWLLFENVNQCTPSVLDRLNSLLEPNGTILLTENGTGQIIKPHENFRIFFTMDSTNGGEISRAMRNRCVECFCPLSIDADLILGEIAREDTREGQFAMLKRSCLTALVKSSRAAQLEITDMSGGNLKLLAASTKSWVDVSKRISLYRVYQKFSYFLNVMEKDFPLSVPRSAILFLAAELMGPLVNLRVVNSYIRRLLESGGSDSSPRMMDSLDAVPVRNMPYELVFGCLPDLVTASLQLVFVLAGFKNAGSNVVYCRSAAAEEIANLGAISISDITSPAVLRACGACARLSAQSRDFVALLNSFTASFGNDVIFSGEQSQADYSSLYASAVANLIRVVSFLASEFVTDILFAYVTSSAAASMWRGDSHLLQWVLTMIRFLRHSKTYTTGSAFEDGALGSYLSPVSVSLRLPEKALCDADRVSWSMGICADGAQREPLTGYYLHLVDSLVIPRLKLNFDEVKQSCSLDGALMAQHSGRNSTGISLFLVGEAVDLGKLTSGDSKEIYLISSLYAVLKGCGSVIYGAWAMLCAECLPTISSEAALAVVTEFTRRRDILSNLLLSHSCHLQDMKATALPLDKVVVSVKWLRKSIKNCLDMFDEFSSVLPVSPLATFKQSAADLKVTLDKFNRSIDMYWGYQNRTVSNAKSGRLWKLGGHAAVPYMSGDWPHLLTLRKLIAPVDVTSMLRCFADIASTPGLAAVVEENSIVTHKLFQRRKNLEVVRDWLGLYSTYYWSKTRELEEFGVSRKGRVSSNIDMDLISAQFSELVAVSWGNGLPSDVIPDNADGGSQHMYTGHQYELIASENESCGEAFMTAAAELHVLRTLSNISNQLSHIILKARIRLSAKHSGISQLDNVFQSSVNSMKSISRTATRAIEVAIRFTMFDPAHLRELQSLVWVLDSMVHDFKKIKIVQDKEDKWISFENVARAYIVTLESRLGSFYASNMANFMNSVDFSWMSPTLLSSLDLVSKKKFSKLDGSVSATAMNGPGMLLRPMGLETVLRMIDFRALATTPSAMRLAVEANAYVKSSGLIGDGSMAEIPLSTCADVRTRIHQLYRMYIHCHRREDVAAENISNMSQVHFDRMVQSSRILQLSLMTIDVVICFLDFVDTKITAQTLSSLIPEVLSESAASLPILLAGLSLFFGRVLVSLADCEETFVNDVACDLWLNCLKPLLRFVSGPCSDNLSTAPSEDVIVAHFSNSIDSGDIGDAWVRLGCLRAHMLLPDAPVDPATVSTVKAALLNGASSDLMELIRTAHWMRSISGDASVSPHLAAAGSLAEADRAKIEVLLRRSIQRRRAITSETDSMDEGSTIAFSDVHDILKKGIENLVSVKKLSHILQRSKELCEAVSSFTSIVEVSKLSDKESQALKASLSGLMFCGDEEANWQGSYLAFQSHVSEVCTEYEDVSSTVLSALENVSFGLRLSVTWRCHRKRASVSEVAVVNSVDAAVSNTLRYPFSSTIVVDARYSSSLLKQLDLQLLRNLNQGLSSVDILVSRTESLCGERSKPVSITALLLQILSKIDYLVGGSLLSPMQVNKMFSAVLKKLLMFQVSSERERKRRQVEKDSMFKNRRKENTFISDDAEEEARSLRLNFPDHLAEFENILNPSDPDNEAGLAGLDDTDSMEGDTEGDGAEEEATGSTALFDFASMAADISSYHARMVFLHEHLDLMENKLCWKTVRGRARLGYSLNNLGINAKKELLNSCINRTLTVTKTLQGTISRLVNPQLDLDLSGVTLLVLSSTAEHCQLNQPAGGGYQSLAALEKVDRDLCFLLFQGSTMYKSPTSFHIDPSKAEIMHAAGPLNRLLKRASVLLMEFPGNEVLLQLCKLTARISQFHVSTPLGKMLASVEMLYREAHNWESYAAKHVSVSEEIKELGSLIARWRQKELQSWEDLLRCKEQDYITKAVQYWFTLSSVFNVAFEFETGPGTNQEEILAGDVNALHIDESNLASSETELTMPDASYMFGSWPALAERCPSWLLVSASQNQKMLAASISADTDENAVVQEAAAQQKLFESLDGFLKGASVGEFPTRLHLVRLFALQLQQRCMRAKKCYAELVSLSNVAMNIWRFYDQFLPGVRSFQDILKSPIQKRIKDEIKISKWDQLSSYGLMEHSEKIHRKLNKIIREYEQEVLDYPVTSLLRKETVGELAGENGDAIAAGSLKQSPSLKIVFPFISKAEPSCLLVSVAEGEEDTEVKAAENEGEEADGVVKKPKIRLRKNRKLKSKKNIVVADTSSFIEGVDFGHCDNVILAEVRALLTGASRLITSNTTSDPSVAAALANFPRVGKVKSLLPKVHKALRSLLLLHPEEDDSTEDVDTSFSRRYISKCRYGYLSHELTEDMCSDIFGQMAGLQGEDVTRNQKQRALKDLFDALKERVGVSQFHIDVPTQFKQTVDMLTVPVPLSAEVAADLMWDFSDPRDQLERAETYFIKNLSEITELRTQVSCEFSSDLSGRDVHMMSGFAENMLMRCCDMRSSVTAFLTDIQAAANEASRLQEMLTNVQQYQSEYMHYRQPLSNGDNSAMSVEEETAVISNALAFNNLVDSAWKYRQVAGGVLINSMLELQKLSEPALLALKQNDSVGCNADISSVFADHHVSYDIASRTLSDMATAVEDLRSALQPDVAIENDRRLATVLHASDVFGYQTVADEAASAAAPKGLVSSSAYALEESAQLIVKLEKKCISCRDILCKLLPPDVVLPIYEQFSNFVSIILSQRISVDALRPEKAASDFSLETSNVRQDGSIEVVPVALQAGIDECLLVVQRLQFLSFAKAPSTGAQVKPKVIKSCFGQRVVTVPTYSDEETSIDIVSCFELNCASASSLQLSNLSKTMSAVSALLTLDGPALPTLSFEWIDHMRSAAVLASSISLCSRVLFEDLIRTYKSFSKFTYMCLRIFRNLIAKGFCTSNAETNVEDGDGSGDGTMTFEDDVEGTGMGEGDGKKDVSDEIENEEQLLGLKDDKPKEPNDPANEKKELSEEDKDKGVEMNQDFEGELYDLPEEKEDEEKQDSEEEEEEEDLDREMDQGGEFSYDNVVDEQQWGSDDDEDEDNHGNREDNKEMFEEGNAMDSDALEGEMRTKDEDEAGKQDGPKEEEEGKDEKEKDNANEEDNDHDDNKGKVNDEDEADTMEKPMGIDVRKPEEDKGAPEDEDDSATPPEGEAEGEEVMADDAKPEPSDGAEGEPVDKNPQDNAPQEDNFDVENMSISDGGDEEDKMSETSEANDEQQEDTADGPDQDSGAAPVQDGGEQDEELDLKDGNRKPKNKKASSSAAFGVQASDGVDAMQKEGLNDDGEQDRADERAASGQASGQGASTKGPSDPQGMDDGADDNAADAPDVTEQPKNEDEAGGGGDNDASGASAADAQSSGSGPPNNRHREPPNPFRKKGDLDKAWHERLNMKKQQQNEKQGGGMDKTSNEDTGASGPSSGVFEYEMNDGESSDGGEDEGGAQVLAETVEGDAMKLQSNATGAEDDNSPSTEAKAKGEDEGGEEGLGAKEEATPSGPSGGASSKRDREADAVGDEMDVDAEETGSEVNDNEPDRKRKKTDDAGESKGKMEMSAEADDQKKRYGSDYGSDADDADDIDRMPSDDNSAAEPDKPNPLDFGGKVLSGKALAGSGTDGHESKIGKEEKADDVDNLEETDDAFDIKDTSVVATAPASALWAHHKSIGEEASMNLCEQLRLILEPNLAARLKGDYRTGKRINMRRVISYVASGFRRDKIWLRRTKLAKRDYQVMVMLDDSCSMGAAGPLALTSLAIISSALSRLEVGDLSVCSFSDHVNMLHPFGTPFSDDSGAGIANALKFNASKTLLAKSLDSVIPVFDAARQGQMSSASGSGVVVQLCFVISDARLDTDNRDRLNNVVRTMAEKHILVVLIVLDQNEDSKDSIFNTKSIEFTEEGIVTRSYLDNFPFPFYVAIQKLSALPNVLADSLKQWFEYVQYSLDSNNN